MNTEDHILTPECPCRPVLVDGGVWVHRSFDGRELDEEGHRIEMDAMSAETIVFFAYWMHWISRGKAIELLQITHQAFDLRLSNWIDRLTQDYKNAEESLRPSAL